MKKGINVVLVLLLVVISFNYGCNSVITDSKLKMIKDSLSNKSEYYDPEYTNKYLMLKCWLNFKSETLVEYTVVTLTTENISQGFHEADRKVYTGKYTINKDNTVYYLDMEFKEKEISANVMHIVGFSYEMVQQTVNLPSKIIVSVDSNNRVVLENWVETNLPVKKEKPVETVKVVEPSNTTHVADTQNTHTENSSTNTVQQTDASNEKKYYNGCGYSYENKEDCMKQCAAFNDGTCPEGPATGQIIKSSK